MVGPSESSPSSCQLIFCPSRYKLRTSLKLVDTPRTVLAVRRILDVFRDHWSALYSQLQGIPDAAWGLVQGQTKGLDDVFVFDA